VDLVKITQDNVAGLWRQFTKQVERLYE